MPKQTTSQIEIPKQSVPLREDGGGGLTSMLRDLTDETFICHLRRFSLTPL